MVEVACKAVADHLAAVRKSQSHAQREIEVKLEGAPELLRQIFTLNALAGVRPRTRAQKLAATYFDTEDGALDRAGMALRIRRTGARRVLTLKWTPFGEGLFSRGEAEARINGDSPELFLLGAELADMVSDATGGEALVPRFETRARRRLGDLHFGSTHVAIAIDEGEIVAGDRRAQIAECELELKAGDPAALFTLAAQLTWEGLRLGPASKSQRGYVLASGGGPSEVRAIHPKFSPEALAEDAISAVVNATLTQFLGNWPALLESNLPESVHQLRVALRRLRSGLRSFEKAFPNGEFERFRSEAKRIASALAPAREQDVFEALVLEGLLSVFERDESFDSLLAASAARRERAYSDARQLLSEPETSRFVLDLQAFVSSRGWRNGLGTEDLSTLALPARVFAADALDRLDRRALKLGKGLTRLTSEQRHRVRIALKNLRYGSDFFASLFDDTRCVKAFTKRLSDLQEALGAHNDEIVARENVAGLERDAGPSASRAAGIVLGWCGRGVNTPDLNLRDAWRAYRKAHRFWR